MTFTQFIKENRSDIDATIRSSMPNIGSINDQERRMWVLNVENLYWWAVRSGVKI